MSETAQFLEELYREQGPALARFFRAARMDRDSAEDLVHDTFREVMRHPERVSRAKSPRAYLFGIARNLRRRFWRRRMRTVSIDGSGEVEDTREEEDPRLEDVRAALRRLSGGHREVLELRLHHGLRYQEIADALDIPVGTVRSRIHHGIGKLRETLRENENN